jgi:DNA-directed RNA polymerase specialized sigma24 family protein
MDAIDPRKVRLVELRYFLGCSVGECADLAGISIATAERDLALIKSWLYLRLCPGKGTPDEALPG